MCSESQTYPLCANQLQEIVVYGEKGCRQYCMCSIKKCLALYKIIKYEINQYPLQFNSHLYKKRLNFILLKGSSMQHVGSLKICIKLC